MVCQHPIKSVRKHGICWVPFSALLSLLRQRGQCRATLSNTKRSQPSQPRSTCCRDIAEVTIQDIIILWGHMEEILSGVSILNSCFSVNHEIDCISSLYWLLGSLEPKLETTYSKYTELNPNYILFFLLLPQIFTFAYFLILLKCTYLHMLLDICFE